MSFYVARYVRRVMRGGAGLACSLAFNISILFFSSYEAP